MSWPRWRRRSDCGTRRPGIPRPAEALRGVVRTGRRARRARRAARVRARSRGSIGGAPGSGAASTPRFDARVAPMARALVLGESDLAPDDDGAFRASGLSHLLAVSGMHLVLVLALAVRVLEGTLRRVEANRGGHRRGPLRRRRRDPDRVALRRVRRRRGLDAPGGVDGHGGARGARARAARRRDARVRSLGRRHGAGGAAGRVRSLVRALRGRHRGLLVFARPLGDRLEAWRLARRVGAGASPRRSLARSGTTLAASVPCAPILARFAPTVPIGGVVANLLAVPLGESAALPLCLAARPARERGRRPSRGARPSPRERSTWSGPSRAPSPRLPSRRRSRSRRHGSSPRSPRRWRLVALRVTAGAAPSRRSVSRPWSRSRSPARRAGAPRGQLRATFLDVGQGDAAILDLPDGEALVVDGGGLVGSPIDVGTRVLGAGASRAPQGRGAAAVVLTHPHPDHFGGLATGLGAVGRREPLGHRPGRARAGGRRLRRAPRGDARPRRAHPPTRRALRLAGSWAASGSRCSRLARAPRRIETRTTIRSSFASRTARAFAAPRRGRAARRGGRAARPARRRASGPTCSRWAITGARRPRRRRSWRPSRPARPSSPSGGATASVTRIR